MATGRPHKAIPNRINKYEIKFDENKFEFYQDVIVKILGEGGTICDVCAEIGITKQIFYNWIEKYPELKTAAEFGKTVGESTWGKMGREALEKEKYNTGMYVLQMRNRYNWKTRDDVVTQINVQAEQDQRTRELVEKAEKIFSDKS